ncbi:hypothetical protein BVG19_g3059 [[Candida] boidinii]|nr:hypothetical protein BVG19_g3059 [[Candida] boidinii]OWB53024.1 hypothetical protein B5S27_g4610 [[Candida] boidinii]
MEDFLYDAHCHLSPFFKDESVQKINKVLKDNYGKRLYVDENEIIPIPTINLMSTTQWDIQFVNRISLENPSIVQPCFGIHPWYSHLFTMEDYSKEAIGCQLSETEIKTKHYSKIFTCMKKGKNEERDSDSLPDLLLDHLPVPKNLYELIKDIELIIEENIRNKQDYEFMIGEIGLDKLFRIPWNGYLGNENEGLINPDSKFNSNSKFSNYQVSIDHQVIIYKEFLKMAIKYNKPVSIHCVKAHGILFDITKSMIKIKDSKCTKLCLHSYSGSIDQAKSWLKLYKKNIFFSISEILNIKGGTRKVKEIGKEEDDGNEDTVDSKCIELLKFLPFENILIETDYGLDFMYLEKNLENQETIEKNEHLDYLKNTREVILSTKSLQDHYEYTKSEIYGNWINFRKSE